MGECTLSTGSGQITNVFDHISASVINQPMEKAIKGILRERLRQKSLFGDQSGKSLYQWATILGEEYGELCEAINETLSEDRKHPDRGGNDKIVKEATQIAAVALAIIESLQDEKEAFEPYAQLLEEIWHED